MKIIISEPIPYFSYGDEDHFFHWLESIPAITNRDWLKKCFELTLTEPIDDASLMELIGLLTRYSLDMKCLKVLHTAQNDHWFADPMAYWHGSVFGK